jgi:ribonucleotide monophosphatase NagD (HAD superfamily)
MRHFGDSNSKEYICKPTVKEGLLAETYKNLGGEIFAIGKPFPQIYRYALEHLAAIIDVSFEDICHKRIAMLGDSLETDILGAKNAGDDLGFQIDSILVLSGLSAGHMEQAYGEVSIETMNKLFRKQTIGPIHVMSSLDLNAEVYF